MATELPIALSKVETAAGILFDADPSVRSVGIGVAADGFGYVAVRNTKAIVPLSTRTGGSAGQFPQYIEGIPVHVINSFADPQNLVRVPNSGVGSPGTVSLVPEQQSHRPLVCGLQIQNYDQDVRSGDIGNGYMVIGTLGCFVKVASGEIAILSNNHVVAGENSGQIGDAIYQPGSATLDPTQHAASLSGFVALKTSPFGASIAAGNVTLNEVDGGVAKLEVGVQYLQAYLPTRTASPPTGIAVASVGDKVHKVGRTTGLTYGTVKQVGTIVGPIPYTPGPC